MRVEAAAYRGKPVSWDLIGPWSRPSRMVPYSRSRGQQAAIFISIVILFTLIAGAIYFARRNLRMGRGDRRGASRLAGFVFALTAVVWVSSEHHVLAPVEVYLFLLFVCWALFVSGLLWLLYIALEPYVRRRWPVTLISWSRVLSGSFRDPLVGRDLLVGCVVGVLWVLLYRFERPAASWIGVPPEPPFVGPLHLLSGASAVVPVVSQFLVFFTFYGLAALFILFLLRLLLRNQPAAAALFVLIITAWEALDYDSLLLGVIIEGLWSVILLLLLVRFGLLATAAALFSLSILSCFPITAQLSAWYSGVGLAGLFLLLGLTLYAFDTSLGGQPIFGRASIED
jgi:serine/threonine-protein kinase